MTNREIITLLTEYRVHLLKLRSHEQYNYAETRSFLNKNRIHVQRILTTAGTLRFIDVAPPPLVGGYILRNANPMDLIFDPPYDMDIYSLLSDIIEQTIGVIETDPEFGDKLEAKPKHDLRDYDIWSLVHPTIAECSKKRMHNGFYADAVEAACKTLNARVRDIVLDQTGEGLDGAGLMRKAFSPNNPVIQLESSSSRSSKDIQQGYMEISAGVMTGIRNPKAHDNESISKEDALRKLIMISILMFKIDERVVTE